MRESTTIAVTTRRTFPRYLGNGQQANVVPGNSSSSCLSRSTINATENAQNAPEGDVGRTAGKTV